MGSEVKKAMSAQQETSGSSLSKDAHIDELRAARRAALNLMEDAVRAQRRAEILNQQLLEEIQQRTLSENRLRESEEQVRLLTESFEDYAIFTMDLSGDIVTWNPGAKNIFGYDDSEIVGKSSFILFVPEDQADGAPKREMEMARRTGRANDERWHLRKDGRRFYASGIMAPLQNGDELIGYAKIARDLTQQKQTEEELALYRDKLELLIAGRTSELAEANETLISQMENLRRAEEERIALLQRAVTIQEDERRRIARDMHDSLGQQLTGLRLKLASLKTEAAPNTRFEEAIERLQEMSKRIDNEVNFLVWELRPTVLDDLGLAAAIENYVREWSRHSGILAELHTARMGRSRLDGNIETNLYRITQEALNNTSKHSDAQNVNIVLEPRKNEIVLVVEDDGCGFCLEEGKAPTADGGIGLTSMRERAAIIGGTVEIESEPGKGTTVFVRVPIPDSH